ncbi:hypothetical protein Esti_000712 [Eimeria stiedai]
MAATLMRMGPLDRINDSLMHAVNLNPSLEPLLREKLLGLPNVLFDAEAKKYFICSPFNKLRNSYRSPWTNAWVPSTPEAAKPPSQLRQLEAYLNEVYDAYRDAHYGAGVSSVYGWPLQNQDGFVAAFLLLKEMPYDEPSRPLSHYKLFSSLLFHAPSNPTGDLKGGAAAFLSRTVSCCALSLCWTKNAFVANQRAPDAAADTLVAVAAADTLVEQTQKIQDSRAAAAAGSGAPAGVQHMAVGGPLLEKNEAALLEEVAQIHLLRAAQVEP